MTDSPKKKSNRQSAYSWATTPEELQKQVDGYSTLPFTDTFRGAAILFVLGLLGLSVILSLFGIGSFDASTVTEWVIYLVALFFIYKGHRWAIILVMVLWTADKAYQLYEMSTTTGSGSPIMALIWWALVMPYLYKALKVENERRKKAGPSPVAASSHDSRFCTHCGAPKEEGAKFCTSCGTPFSHP